MGFDYRNCRHRIRFLKDRVAIDVIRVREWREWADKNVHTDDWSYLSSADPRTHDFYFVKSEDAVMFKLAFPTL